MRRSDGVRAVGRRGGRRREGIGQRNLAEEALGAAGIDEHAAVGGKRAILGEGGAGTVRVACQPGGLAAVDAGHDRGGHVADGAQAGREVEQERRGGRGLAEVGSDERLDAGREALLDGREGRRRGALRVGEEVARSPWWTQTRARSRAAWWIDAASPYSSPTRKSFRAGRLRLGPAAAVAMRPERGCASVGIPAEVEASVEGAERVLVGGEGSVVAAEV